MSKLFSGVGLLALASSALVLLYAQRRSKETGRDMGSVLSNLPEELRQSQADWTRRMNSAVEVGKRAAAEKEAEIDKQLESRDSDETTARAMHHIE